MKVMMRKRRDPHSPEEREARRREAARLNASRRTNAHASLFYPTWVWRDRALRWKSRLEKQLEEARLESAHAWHLLGGAQVRYLRILKALRLLTSGETIDAQTFGRIVDLINSAPDQLVDEAKLRESAIIAIARLAQDHIAR